MRLTAAGFRTVVADDVYVYHRRAASFRDRAQRYRENRRIFDARWAAEYRRQFAAFRARDPLGPARALFRLPRRWAPLAEMRDTYHRMLHPWVARDPVGLLREAVRGAWRLPQATRAVVTPAAVARVTRPGRLRVTYVLHGLAIYGGVLSVVQLVNELTLLGVEARIAALRERPEVYDWKWLVQPMIFGSWPTLVANFPESDIAVATHWTTARWVARLVASGRARAGVYFIQDYEPWFFPETDGRSRARVRETYGLLPHRIVKSDWLRGLLQGDGVTARRIPLGMDLGVFYPRDVPRQPAPRVLAMARPRTPRRGYPDIVAALRGLKEALPHVEITLFGQDLRAAAVPFPCSTAGVIADQNRLAELYSSADVFLDGSVFQGFGRPALEAMACGAACVLTNVGGVLEYARDGENCLLVPPGRPDLFAGAMRRILEDPALGQRLRDGGLKTAREYCVKREARETLDYFTEISGVEPPGR
jgi:glycosyltransferase involved in cell wall biosynthesis